MKWYFALLNRAGLDVNSKSVSIALPLIFSFAIGFIVTASTQVIGLGVATTTMSLAAFLELLSVVATRRASVIADCWPEVLEALQSSTLASLSLTQAFEDLSVAGPIPLRRVFHSISAALTRGYRVDDCLEVLKRRLALVEVDQLVELLKLSQRQGGLGLAKMLGEMAQQLRTDKALYKEIAAKQGWVANTAKLGLIAPWVVVAMLGARHENALVYASPNGTVALLLGLVVCLVAYGSIRLMATLPQPRRVFASAN